MTALSASWIVVQLSTNVLSQSNRIARGRARSCAVGARPIAVIPLPEHEPGNARAIFERGGRRAASDRQQTDRGELMTSTLDMHASGAGRQILAIDVGETRHDCSSPRDPRSPRPES